MGVDEVGGRTSTCEQVMAGVMGMKQEDGGRCAWMATTSVAPSLKLEVPRKIRLYRQSAFF